MLVVLPPLLDVLVVAPLLLVVVPLLLLVVLPLLLPVKPLLDVDVPLLPVVGLPLDVLVPRLFPVAVVHRGFDVVVSPASSSSHPPAVDARSIAATAHVAWNPRLTPIS